VQCLYTPQERCLGRVGLSPPLRLRKRENCHKRIFLFMGRVFD